MSENGNGDRSLMGLGELLGIGRPQPGWVFPASLALGAGLWAASLPPYGLAILALLAPVAPMAFLAGNTPARAFRWGWIGGFLWEAVTLWWLVPTLARYGGLSAITASLLIAGMCLFLGAYSGAFYGGLALLVRRRGPGALLLAPALWVLLEWLKGHLFSGFPWWSPGYALTLYPVLLQPARLCGVLGLSLLALLISTAVALGIRDRSSKAALAASLLAVLLFAGACSYGLNILLDKPAPAEKVRVGYLQPEVPQDLKWDPLFFEQMEARLFGLSAVFKPYKLRLLVWPESCTPQDWEADEVFRARMGALASEIRAPVLFGTTLGGNGAPDRVGAVLAGPGGVELGTYAKAHLVPFGEYVPLRSLLSFARPLVQAVGDFSPGQDPSPLRSPAGKLGVTICFEGIFPSLVRERVLHGAEILVNITNDAWYSGTPGPAQHFFIQRVRAVETGRYLIRSANGGYSGVVNPRGKFEAGIGPGSPASFWGEVTPMAGRTPFVRYGDRWLWGLLLILVLGAALPSTRRASS